MTKPRGPYLQFGCPRCMARLRARPSQVGTKQRCPRCQFVLVVPTAEQAARLARRPEPYPLFEGNYQDQLDPQRAAETAAVADCRVCGTRIYAPEGQIGRKVECPDCGTMVVVAARPVVPAEGGLSADEAEAYALLDQFYESPESPSAEAPSPAEQVYIPVYCTVCNTLLHGTLKEVGRHLLCPDCNTPVLVPPPKESAEAKWQAAHPVEDEYALKEEMPKPTGRSGPEEEQSLIPVVCRLCGTRMYATADQAGELITCPDCSTPAVVPRPEAPPPKPDREATAVGEYGVGAPVERAKYEPKADVRLMRIEPGDTKALEEAGTAGIVYVRPAPPDRPFSRGIIGFLWQPSTWPRLIGMTAGLLVVLFPVIYGVSLMVIIPVAGLISAPPLVGAMVLMAVGGVGCLIWLAAASPLLLAVIQDTSEGNDSVESWPDAIFSDWALDFFYFVDSACVSLILGIGIGRLLASATPLSWLALPIAVFVVFPITLLSMLEGNSPLRAVSLNILGSLFSVWWAWALFYFETAVLIGGYLYLSGLVMRFVGPWGLLLAVLPAAAVIMVYCRILGRLAWCIGRVSGRGEDERRAAAHDRRPPAADKAPPRAPAPPQEAPPTPPPSPKPASSILDDDFDLS